MEASMDMKKPYLNVRLVRKEEERQPPAAPELQFSDMSERDLERAADKLAKVWRVNQKNGKRKVA